MFFFFFFFFLFFFFSIPTCFFFLFFFSQFCLYLILSLRALKLTADWSRLLFDYPMRWAAFPLCNNNPNRIANSLTLNPIPFLLYFFPPLFVRFYLLFYLLFYFIYFLFAFEILTTLLTKH